MAALYVSDPDLFSELTNIWRLFAPDRSVEQARLVPRTADLGMAVYPDRNGGTVAELYANGGCAARVRDDTRFLELHVSARQERRARLHQAKRALYRLLSSYFGRYSPWGALTGIRPTKLYRELWDRYGQDAAASEFENSYLVSPERIRLADEIVRVQRPLLGADNEAVVYVGIPFCPGRCSYCSFIAQDVAAGRAARAQYLPALLQELERGAHIAGSYDVSSVYVGGGTPTTFDEAELDELLGTLRRLFPAASEWTVEAGRPDTVTEAKLGAMQRHGVTRVCINPQTTCDETLRRIGRGHTADDFFRAMDMAQGRSWVVNTDLIIGLPGENPDILARSLQDVLRYDPQNITVHALAVKNAAGFASDRYDILPDAEQAACMAQVASELLMSAGYRPYYMYRQKYMSGNLENVGYALAGTESVYNVANMEETASVLAFGAGAISKRVDRSANRVERAPNVKDPMQYISRVDEMAERKTKLFEAAH